MWRYGNALSSGGDELKLMVDWFAGLGGASEAFVRSKSWSVLRYDNNVELINVECMQMLDLLDVDLEKFKTEIRHPIDLFWASPECREFSLGFSGPRATAQREGRDYQPDLRQIEKIIQFIKIMEPKYFIVENVRGAIEYFSKYPELGEPRQIINGSIFLWGNFPLISLPADYNHKKSDVDVWSDNPMRYNIVSKIPYAISNGLKKAVENQKNIEDYY